MRVRGAAAGRPSVLVVYQHLPHYRYGVFAALDSSEEIEVEFAAGDDDFVGGIPTIPRQALGTVHPLRNAWRGPVLWQRGLLSLVLRGHYDAVVFLGDAAFLSTWLGAALARIKGQRVLFWTIGWHRPEHGARRLVRMAFYRLAHRLLLYGNLATELGTSMGYPAARMSVVYNSVTPLPDDVSLPDIDDHELAIALPPPGVEMVVAVARLTERKRFDLLIQAVALLGDGGRRVVVMLVGDGPARHDLEVLAKQLDVDLRMPGSVFGAAKLARIYEHAALSILPTFAGLTTVQSLAHGRAVITDDNPYDQAPEWEAIVAGRTGAYYRNGSASSLAAVTRRWLDRVAADRCGVDAACREVVDARWNPTGQAQRVSDAVCDELQHRP